jgi:hypothetical protein
VLAEELGVQPDVATAVDAVRAGREQQPVQILDPVTGDDVGDLWEQEIVLGGGQWIVNADGQQEMVNFYVPADAANALLGDDGEEHVEEEEVEDWQPWPADRAGAADDAYTGFAGVYNEDM